MPDGSPRPSQASSLPEIKISQLPVASAANLTDQLEANQAGTTRSITVGQVAALSPPPDLSAYAKLASPTFTGDPQAPTPATADNDTSIATTAYVKANIAAIPLSGYAPLASPTFTGDPKAPTATPGDNDTSIATTAFVQAALGSVSVTVPAGTVAYGGTGGVLTGDSGLAWNSTGKNLAITGYTGAAAAFSAAGSVPASPAVDAFLMSISNPSGNTGNIFRLRAGAAGTTDQFKVDMTGDGAFSGSVQAFALSAPPAGGGSAFAYFLGNFSGGNIGLYFGTGAPTVSTLGKYGSLYMNAASPGLPYYNNNGTTGWDQLVGLAATQTLTNKSATTPAPGDNTTKIATTAYVQAALAAGASISVGDTPPGSPGANALWWNSVLGTLFLYYNDGNSTQWVPAAPSPSGAVLQTVSVETGALATGTTIIPLDDTIPQQTEGDQYMSLAITPRSATSRLIIEVVFNGSSSAGSDLIVALFQDTTANALAATVALMITGTGRQNFSFRHVMISGTTSPTTFKVRAGGGVAGTTTFNGAGAGRYFGGVMASSIVITEVSS